MATPEERIRKHLQFLYPDDADRLWEIMEVKLEAYATTYPQEGEVRPPAERLSQRDAVLITYGDQVQEPGRAPLQTLAEVGAEWLDGVVSAVHILPFFPYSSDDGFSVIDYRAVNPDFGTWEDVDRLGKRFQLMFDAVINHISRESAWFKGYLEGADPYTRYFITVPEGTDLSMVVRPRALPLLTAVDAAGGQSLVWTTFSEDQIDLNFSEPLLAFEIVELLLFYAAHGAEIIRLDAIAYLWKEIGTTCIHLPQTHEVVKLFRAVLDAVAPEVLLITETNVPHEENISYFGQPLPGGGTDEAQLVYQFSLAPLTMHSILSGDASVLTAWAAGLEPPAQATFFNFTASHDGIGVRPAEGLLTPAEIAALAQAALDYGGYVSYKNNADGSQSAYELNISYFDALSDPAADEPLDTKVARFVVSQAIMLALAGVPGIYVHSLFGSQSWREGAEQTGHNRTINRQKFDRADLDRALRDPNSLRCKVFSAYSTLLRARASEPAFHPFGEQSALDLDSRLFALLRAATDAGGRKALCLHNVSSEEVSVSVPQFMLGEEQTCWQDIVTGTVYEMREGELTVSLPAYGVLWLRG